MAPHSSVLAWRIPGTGEPGGLQTMGSQGVIHDWVTNTWKEEQYVFLLLRLCKSLRCWERAAPWKCNCIFVVVVVQPLSHVWLFVTPWTSACQTYLSRTLSHSPSKFMSIVLVMPSNHLILFSFCLQSFPSIRVFSNESAVHISSFFFFFGTSRKSSHPKCFMCLPR